MEAIQVIELFLVLQLSAYRTGDDRLIIIEYIESIVDYLGCLRMV